MRYRLPPGHPLRSPGKPARGNFVDTWGDLAHVPDLTVYEGDPWLTGGVIHPETEERIRYYVGPDRIGFLWSEDEDEDA